MNISVYLFGEFSVGYSQYPNDYAKIIFESFAKSAQATTQITIHRDGDLMYYGYIRKMENAEYLGVCVVVNGNISPNCMGCLPFTSKSLSRWSELVT